MFSKLVILITAFVVAVNAQSSGSPTSSAAGVAVPSLSPCVQECLTKAAALDDCGTFTNVTCVCTSSQFQADAGACLVTNCPTDVQGALALQSAECGALSLSATGPSATPQSISFTTPASGTVTGTATSPASASSGSTRPSSGTATTGAGTGSTAPTTSATTPASAASSLVGHSGVAALVAMIAGLLAL